MHCKPTLLETATSASLCAPTAQPYLWTMSKSDMPKGLVVSIVDDDPSVCEGLQDLLNSMGLAATTFRCAEDFLKSDRLETTSCLIADVQMPGMSGIELYDYLGRSGRPIPTILITAFPRDADRAQVKRAGVCCYLSKPFSETDLLACIQLTLGPPAGGAD